MRKNNSILVYLLFYLVFISTITTIGCKQLMLKMGVAQPKIESHQSLKSFLEMYEIPKEIDILVFENQESLHKKINSGLSIPNAYFFNSDGYFVDYHIDPNSYNASVGPFLKNAAYINKMEFDINNHISKYNGILVNSETNKPIQLAEYGSIDGYLVIYWAKYAGKMNKNKAFDWVKIYKKGLNDGANLQLIFLNCDYQDSWNILENDLTKIKF